MSKEISLDLPSGGTSSAVSISSTSAQSAIINNRVAVVTPSVDCFVRQGPDPTALSDGTDQFLYGGQMYRLCMSAGNKLAFKTTAASGTVYITPGA